MKIVVGAYTCCSGHPEVTVLGQDDVLHPHAKLKVFVRVTHPVMEVNLK